MLEDLDRSDLQDPVTARRLVERLLHPVEQLSTDLAQVTAEKQHLQDALNRLQGEQAKPASPGTA